MNRFTPRQKGWLAVGGGHHIYWEEYGNPKGTTVLGLHGGPGDRMQHYLLKACDLKRQRVILHDQRGCGRSRPFGGRANNTTADLLGDIRRLQDFFGIESAVVVGGSWGSTLALLYAQQNPQRVRRLIVSGIFLGRAQDDRWLFQSSRLFFPELWEELALPFPAKQRANLLQAYARGLADPCRAPALSRRLSDYMGRLTYLLPRPGGAKANTRELVASMRIFLQYAQAGYYLKTNQILKNMRRIRHIPGTILSGRYDMDTPPVQAYLLSKAWPRAKWVMVENAGHSQSEPDTLTALRREIRLVR